MRKANSLLLNIGCTSEEIVTGSVEVSPFRPRLGKIFPRLPAQINGQARLFRQRVLRADGLDCVYFGKRAIQAVFRKSNRENHVARRAARSPGAILIVSADGLGQRVVFAEEINRTRLAVVVGQKSDLRLLVSGQ